MVRIGGRAFVPREVWNAARPATPVSGSYDEWFRSLLDATISSRATKADIDDALVPRKLGIEEIITFRHSLGRVKDIFLKGMGEAMDYPKVDKPTYYYIITKEPLQWKLVTSTSTAIWHESVFDLGIIAKRIYFKFIYNYNAGFEITIGIGKTFEIGTDCYFIDHCDLRSAADFQLRKRVAGAVTVLATESVDLARGVNIEVDLIIGDGFIRVFRDGALKFEVEDEAITSFRSLVFMQYDSAAVPSDYPVLIRMPVLLLYE